MKEYKVVENDDGSINHYDKNNNEIYFKNSEGYEAWREYDKNNNEIYFKNSNGYESWYEYDNYNNLIHYKNSNGYEAWREYDKNNNLIYYKDSYRNEDFYIDKKLVTEEEFKSVYKQVWIKK